MTDSTTGDQVLVLEREFLGLRGRLLEVAATLDRIERASQSAAGDPRWTQLQEGLDAIRSPSHAAQRAQQFQMIFSLPYDPQWRSPR